MTLAGQVKTSGNRRFKLSETWSAERAKFSDSEESDILLNIYITERGVFCEIGVIFGRIREPARFWGCVRMHIRTWGLCATATGLRLNVPFFDDPRFLPKKNNWPLSDIQV
jgi:hypothetical protein